MDLQSAQRSFPKHSPACTTHTTKGSQLEFGSFKKLLNITSDNMRMLFMQVHVSFAAGQWTHRYFW